METGRIHRQGNADADARTVAGNTSASAPDGFASTLTKVIHWGWRLGFWIAPRQMSKIIVRGSLREIGFNQRETEKMLNRIWR